MKKIKQFGFGEIVRPTYLAYKKHIFSHRVLKRPIVGVVVYHSKKYAERLSVRVVIDGQRSIGNYSVNFWEHAPINWLKGIKS